MKAFIAHAAHELGHAIFALLIGLAFGWAVWGSFYLLLGTPGAV